MSLTLREVNAISLHRSHLPLNYFNGYTSQLLKEIFPWAAYTYLFLCQHQPKVIFFPLVFSQGYMKPQLPLPRIWPLNHFWTVLNKEISLFSYLVWYIFHSFSTALVLLCKYRDYSSKFPLFHFHIN